MTSSTTANLYLHPTTSQVCDAKDGSTTAAQCGTPAAESLLVANGTVSFPSTTESSTVQFINPPSIPSPRIIRDDAREEREMVLLPGKRQLLGYFSRSYIHYPILSSVMHVLSVSAMLLLVADRLSREILINPYLLLWALIGFGGMSIVLASAAREIDTAR